ncbi:FUSC family protein [Paracandidimonas soli]|uniref:FUSC family protein n=1 Tax=Paracandidimonas soli TaxID=1917182 RepID=UPI0033423425
MTSSLPQLERFLYSHHSFAGLRQAIGILVPAIVLAGMFQLYDMGMVAALGALCVSLIDQPGGPRRYRTNEMLGGVVLGTGTVALTGLASAHPLALWILVPSLCFGFCMLTVFGKRGGQIGFACLLLMTLTMHTPMEPGQVLRHTLFSLLGGSFYFLFSYAVSRLLWYREEQHTLSVALFATADYIDARARFYDVANDLEDCYRKLILVQADMIEKHQSARDIVLRELPRGGHASDTRRQMLLDVFIHMIDLLDTMVATHTDYGVLRRRLSDSDFLVFAQDALQKLSQNINRISLGVARNRVPERNSRVQAELRALEYELELYRSQGLNRTEPDIYLLLVQILRRLRNATRIVERMSSLASPPDKSAQAVDVRMDKSLGRFLSRQELRPGLLASNLRLDSAHFRYALRMTIALLAAMGLTSVLSLVGDQYDTVSALTTQSHWILLTIILIMKPGFLITRKRNGWRLLGSLLGCFLSFLLFHLTGNQDLLLIVLVASCVLGNSLVLVNPLLAAVFNTLFVLVAFNFMAPITTLIIGERLLDTLLGCMIALACSYVLPWWEHSGMASLAREAQEANLDYLRKGLRYAELVRQERATTAPGLMEGTDLPISMQDALQAGGNAAAQPLQLSEAAQEAELAWKLARKNVHIAFSNFASAFYRMMGEPPSKQRNVPELNSLLIQNHMMASQISAAIPILASVKTLPETIAATLAYVEGTLSGQDAQPPAHQSIPEEWESLAYPLKQMQRAAQLIQREMRGL